MSKTLTRADLVTLLTEKIGFTQQESNNIIEALFSEISEALEKGENVRIWGFGCFMLRDKPSRPGRNPRTGVAATIRPRRVVTFRPGIGLRRKLTDDHV